MAPAERICSNRKEFQAKKLKTWIESEEKPMDK